MSAGEGAVVAASLESAIGTVRLARGGPAGAPPVVYLHSAGGEGLGEVASFLGALAAGHEVVAPMLPGFGGSEGLSEVDDMEDVAYHLLDLFDRLGLTGGRRPHLVGQSLGGWAAVEVAWRHPEAVASLTLVNPVGLYVPGHPVRELFGRRLDDLARDTFADQSHPTAAAMHAMASLGPRNAGSVPFELVRPFLEAMAAAAKLGWNPYFHNPRLGRRLVRVSMPTLVIVGRRDGLVPNAVGEELARLIGGARLHHVDDGSHMLTLEHPEAMARLVAEHVAG